MRVQENPERAEAQGATTAQCPCGAEFVLVPVDAFPLDDGSVGYVTCHSCGQGYTWKYDLGNKRLTVEKA